VTSPAWVSLADLTQHRPICYGVLKPGERDPEGVPLVRITDIKSNKLDEEHLYLISPALHQEFRRSQLRGGEVLLSIQGTIGRTAICPPHLAGANVSRTIAVIDPDSRCLADYLRYWLLSQDGKFPVGGSTRASLNIGALRRLRVPVPPLEEQERIVRLLDETFTHIDQAERNYASVEDELQALWASALAHEFTESTSVTLSPHQNPGTPASSDCPAVSLEELIRDEVVELGRGNVISRKDLNATPGNYPVYSSAKNDQGKFGEYGLYMFDEELITWSIDGGGKFFHRPHHRFSVTNVGGTLRIKKSDRLNYRYLYFALTHLHSRIRFDWVRKAHPSVIRKLYLDIPVPPLEEQERIVERLDHMSDLVDLAREKNADQLKAAEDLRTAVLSSVFSQPGDA
jgi:restriction endonuclease S subunit